MIKFKNFLLLNLFLVFLFVNSKSFAENENLLEILELMQKDLKTLEKAVYSDSFNNSSGNSSSSTLDKNDEDVLTRHLLKLSEELKKSREEIKEGE